MLGPSFCCQLALAEFMAKFVNPDMLTMNAKSAPALVTVNSGRRRINSQTAPIELLQILAGQNGSRAQLAAQIGRRFLRVRPTTDVLVFQNQNGAAVQPYAP